MHRATEKAANGPASSVLSPLMENLPFHPSRRVDPCSPVCPMLRPDACILFLCYIWCRRQKWGGCEFFTNRGATLRPAEISAAAEFLLRMRSNGRKITDLPDAFRPASLNDAYAIQSCLVAKLATSSVGWFVALTSPEMQAVHRASGPIYGRILRSNLHRSPGVVGLRSSERSVTVEAEYAVKMARDLTPGPAYTEAVVSEA